MFGGGMPITGGPPIIGGWPDCSWMSFKSIESSFAPALGYELRQTSGMSNINPNID